jgi:hypothetical protein
MRGIKTLQGPEFENLEKRADEILEIWKLADALGDPDTEGGLFNGLARQISREAKKRSRLLRIPNQLPPIFLGGQSASDFR